MELFAEHSEPFTVMGSTLGALTDATVSVVEPEVPPKVAVIMVGPVEPVGDVAIPVLLMVIDVVDVLQVTCVVKSCAILSEYVPVAVNCCVVSARARILGLLGVTVMDCSVAEVTVTVVEPEVLPKVAVMVAVPVDPAVASPFDPFVLLMSATDVADELQVTAVVKSCVRLSSYTPVAVNCCEVVMAILGLEGVKSIAIRAGLVEAPVGLLEPPPLQPVASAKARKKRRILLDFTNAHSRRNQVGYISPAL